MIAFELESRGTALTASRRAGRKSRRSDRLLAALGGREAAIVTHDNPDPDAIAAGWALHTLFRARDLKSRLVGRGAVVRAENLHMIRLLNPPLELLDELPSNGVAAVLVDCVPTAANHLLDRSEVSAVAVIDHHEPNGHRFRVKYRDIRPRAAATASIAASYLREQDIEPGSDLATAILFAIRSEMCGHDVMLTRADRGVITWLSSFADHTKLASIGNAPLSRTYFSDLLLALENTFLYDDSAVCFLPRASGSEIVGEVADMLIRCEGVERVLSAAAIGNDLVLSARTTPSGGDAVEPLGIALRGLGHWGGHRHRAGGKISDFAQRGTTHDAVNAMVKSRWLTSRDSNQQRGTRLVRRQTILEHL
jgi:nanoRNase/pAp phosphatase (c-di-AMP/oligoRNAs hydrolase)